MVSFKDLSGNKLVSLLCGYGVHEFADGCLLAYTSSNRLTGIFRFSSFHGIVAFIEGLGVFFVRLINLTHCLCGSGGQDFASAFGSYRKPGGTRSLTLALGLDTLFEFVHLGCRTPQQTNGFVGSLHSRCQNLFTCVKGRVDISGPGRVSETTAANLLVHALLYQPFCVRYAVLFCLLDGLDFVFDILDLFAEFMIEFGQSSLLKLQPLYRLDMVGVGLLLQDLARAANEEIAYSSLVLASHIFD